MKSFFQSLSTSARIGLLIGVVVVVGGTFFAALSLGGPRFGVLFNDLREADAAAISEQLDAWKVPFQIHDDGRTLTVPTEQVHSTRLRLVSAGVPSGGRVGFELFKDSNFGVTEFAQKVNFQRALQGELERTIAAFEAVEHVRVHLNLNEGKGLLGRDQPNKASVALTLRPAARLSAAQVGGIRNLVASSVEGLQPESVVVLDESGTPLADTRDVGDHSIAERLADQSRLESLIRERIAELLGPIFALEDVRIAVDVQLNLDRVSLEKEQIRPQRAEAVAPVARERRDGQPAAASPSNDQPRRLRMAQPELEYVQGRELEQVIPAPGRIDRLSVAILVPDTVDEDTLLKLRTVISAAVGLQPERGDHVEIGALIPPRAHSIGLESSEPAASLEPGAAQSTPELATPSTRYWPMLIVALTTLAFGLLLGRVSRRRELTHAEREAAMVQIRAWLRQEGAQ